LDEARDRMEELVRRVRAGESAAGAATRLGISLAQARRLGFKVSSVRPGPGSEHRGLGRRAEVVDLLAWVDPDTGEELRQREVARLAGVAQQTVSKIAKELAQ
jgi:hypothetical protein